MLSMRAPSQLIPLSHLALDFFMHESRTKFPSCVNFVFNVMENLKKCNLNKNGFEHFGYCLRSLSFQSQECYLPVTN